MELTSVNTGLISSLTGSGSGSSNNGPNGSSSFTGSGSLIGSWTWTGSSLTGTTFGSGLITGLATGLKVGTAKVTAVSTSLNGVTSNEFEVTVYEQDDIYDPNNLLVGKTFSANEVVNGTNKFDVVFNIKNTTTAELTLLVNVPGLPTPFENKVDASFEEFDAANKIYYFSTSDDATIKFRVAEDGSYIEFSYFKGDAYTLGSAEQGVILRKAA